MLLELASFASRNEQAKGLHETADLIGELGRDLNQPVPRRHQRASEHAVEALDPHFTKKANLGELRQTIGIVRIRLVGAMSRAALAWRASMQIAGSPSAVRV